MKTLLEFLPYLLLGVIVTVLSSLFGIAVFVTLGLLFKAIGLIPFAALILVWILISVFLYVTRKAN